MTFAGATGLYVAGDMLHAGKEGPVPRDRSLDAGMKWIARNLKDNHSPYEWYVLGELGHATKRSEFGGKDWYQLGAKQVVPRLKAGMHGSVPDLVYGINFLAEGIDPVIINRLQPPGGGRLFRNDIRHITDYISDRFCYPKDWRVVTLDADLEHLVKVPILYIAGDAALALTDADKTKLRAYVDRGGVILAANGAERGAFDKSFRALAAELWPERQLEALPLKHRLYTTPRPLKEFKPEILGMTIPGQVERLGVIYVSDKEVPRLWHRGGTEAKKAFDLGANIYFHLYKTNRRLERDREAKP